MSHVRITATADGTLLVDRHIEVNCSDRVEAALAAAFADVLEGACLAREVAPEETLPEGREGIVTLHAYAGPRAAPGDSEAGAAAAKARPIGRFEVVRAAGKRPRKPWYGPPRRKGRANRAGPARTPRADKKPAEGGKHDS